MPMKRNNFKGEVAFVTRAASGIGQATAIAFASEGAYGYFRPAEPGNSQQHKSGRRTGARGQVRCITNKRCEGLSWTGHRNLRTS